MKAKYDRVNAGLLALRDSFAQEKMDTRVERVAQKAAISILDEAIRAIVELSDIEQRYYSTVDNREGDIKHGNHT